MQGEARGKRLLRYCFPENPGREQEGQEIHLEPVMVSQDNTVIAFGANKERTGNEALALVMTRTG